MAKKSRFLTQKLKYLCNWGFVTIQFLDKNHFWRQNSNIYVSEILPKSKFWRKSWSFELVLCRTDQLLERIRHYDVPPWAQSRSKRLEISSNWSKDGGTKCFTETATLFKKCLRHCRQRAGFVLDRIGHYKDATKRQGLIVFGKFGNF